MQEIQLQSPEPNLCKREEFSEKSCLSHNELCDTELPDVKPCYRPRLD